MGVGAKLSQSLTPSDGESGGGASEKCTGVSIGVFLVAIPAREDNTDNL